ncbi:nitroreductase family deazaflavin-dependent oxidoreductase [Cellulomonas sp. NS3]|uniref:nitroreductase family deazaflavin-dependent oxidoreductase n=1 Tax=Cellulomonas sp. NS3 TaxID=2973977 RepID=UPI002163F9E7|nr:nitroreductase family deazaflavin-dependent oxidoreductase [Cellulomonas sp. NS3]
MDVRETNRRVVEQFRAGGPVEGMHRERLLLLTTTGARSGRPHTTPMMFHREGDRLLVVASAMGAPAHPHWYGNLVAEPHVRVEVGDEAFDAVAAPLAGTDRTDVWARLVALYPFFGEHAAATSRTIPVVELTRT